MNLPLLTALAETSGPSGREERVRAIVEAELEPLCDRLEVDPLGGVVGYRQGADASGPTLMLAGHMDEIGLMVTHIDDHGFLRVIPLGGWDARTLVDQRVLVQGRQDLEGVVGTTPVHLLSEAERGKNLKVEDLAIDLGLSVERVREVVRPGDVATRIRDLRPLGDLLTGKSLDDRVGLFVMIEALRAAGPAPTTVAAAATVQEEVGLRGSRVATTRVGPDIALAIDTCPADDGPGGRRSGATTLLGKGAAIRVMDASAIGSHALVDRLERVAVERGIPHQFHVANRGGTDTASLQLSGTGSVAGCISIPSRYVHSSVELVHPEDVQAAIDLVVGLIDTAHHLVA